MACRNTKKRRNKIGCDIHAFFEIKLKGKWFAYNKLNIDRNYKLFSKMAGVRQVEGVEPIALPRGLPDDISEVVKMESKRWEGYYHSWSWLNASEIRQLIEFHKNMFPISEKWRIELSQWGYLCSESWCSFEENRQLFPDEIEDIRLVFWFDN